MQTRWAAWPQRIRWLAGGIAAVVLVVALAWVLFVPASDWLAHHDVGSASGSLLQTAREAVRAQLLTLGAGLFAAGALVYTARNFALSREGQVTDRYTNAIGHLGSKKMDVRIGSIYALERVARDSVRDHPTVMEVLAAFIREHSHEQWPPLGPEGQERTRSTRPDVQAAVTVVVRRDQKRDIRPTDLTGIDLTGINLADADLTGINLTGANLTGAALVRATLTGVDLFRTTLFHANLDRADLIRAFLTNADLEGANLIGADLHRATLAGAHLIGVNLVRANLTHADLTHADLEGADLGGAHLTGANLTDANLAGANLAGANLTRATLTAVRWPEAAPVPEGWRLDTRSSRLVAADDDSGPAEAS
jgi:uncharacterized protein YjbI with pentapeptide repeats